MEYINIKKNWKDIAFKIATIIVLLFIAYELFEVRQKVKEHYEAFDENPLLFGMKKYDIVEARGTTSKGVVIFFSQDKIWIENEKQINFEVQNFNITDSLWDKQT